MLAADLFVQSGSASFEHETCALLPECNLSPDLWSGGPGNNLQLVSPGVRIKDTPSARPVRAVF